MKLVITDLDNTLYDWVTYYARAFQAMVAPLPALLDVPMAQILDEFQAEHRRLHNSEHPHALTALPSVLRRFPNTTRAQRLVHLAPAVSAFERARDKHLRLYAGVQFSLRKLRRAGIRVVGHTESIAAQALGRLHKLHIWDCFAHLYALAGSESLPLPEADVLRVTLLPAEERKPNPDLLRDICARQGVALRDALYVGDSLTRDMSMARRAGVIAVWARYGTRYAPDLWDTLVRITHWTEEDVAREARLKQQYGGCRPDYVIDGFSDIEAWIPGHAAMPLPSMGEAVTVRTSTG